MILYRRFGGNLRRGWACGLWFAFVGVELLLNRGLRFRLLASRMKDCGKLSVAELADSEHRNVPDASYNSKISLGHGDSFPQSAGVRQCKQKAPRRSGAPGEDE